MTRFFVSPEELGNDTIQLVGENASHAKVLRLKAGEQVLVCDGEGRECLCAVVDSGWNLEVLERRESVSEPGVRVSVYMAFPKSDKLERWQKIAASAAEQSGRGRIPRVVVLPSLAEALKRGGEAELPMLFYENERATTLHMALNSGEWKTAALLTGPEGGLEEKEVAQAMAAGWKVCTLGKRILRCETAPLCALSAVMYAAGEF